MITLARTPLATLMNNTIKAEVNDILLNLAAQLQSSSITQAQHDQAEADVNSYQGNMYTNLDRRGQCSGLSSYNYPGYPASGTSAGVYVPSDTVYDASIGGGAALVPVSLTPPNGTTLSYNSILPNSTNNCPSSCVCTKLELVAEAASTARFDTMQTKLVSRLDRTNGRLGAQKARKLALLKTITQDTPELFEFIIDLSKGLEPLTNPEQAVLDDIIAVYVGGPLAYGINGQPNAADSALQRSTILEVNSTNPSGRGILVERSQVRSSSTHHMHTPCHEDRWARRSPLTSAECAFHFPCSP